MKLDILADLGFSKGEIKTYEAILKLKESTIGPIAKEANVTPAKTYLALDKLIAKGIVSSVTKNGRKHFQALNPERILDLLDTREHELQQKRKELQKIIPRLISEEPQEYYATVYESYDGLKNLYDQAIRTLEKNKEDFIGFTLNEEQEYENAKHFFKHYDKLRAQKGIKTRLLGLTSQKEFIDKNYKKRGIEFRFVDHGLPTGTIIFGNNVATLLWKETPRAFVIHSKETAQAYKSFFEDLWKSAN